MIEKYVCLGSRLNDKNKLVKIFYKINKDGSINELKSLLFSKDKKETYFFGQIYDIDERGTRCLIKITKEQFNGDVKKYIIIDNEHRNYYNEEKEKKKILAEKRRLEKEKLSLDKFTLGELKKMLVFKKFSISTFSYLIQNWKDEVEREYYRGKLK